MKLIVTFWFLLCNTAFSMLEAKSYVPIGSIQGGQNASYGAFYSAKMEDRPFLPGIRPTELELLEDALRRKMPRTIGESRVQAQNKIIRNSLRDPVKRAHIKGVLAEALYLEKNPKWGYVAKPNAPQIDVYTWRVGQRRPFGAQIKTHGTANPLIYAKDMVEDYKAPLFLVPDDHVNPLKDHWKIQLQEHELAGRNREVTDARRQLSRIRGLGFTSRELDHSYTKVARFAFREQYAGYVSLGSGLAMAIGPQMWNIWQTGSFTDQTMHQSVQMVSVLATERATTRLLSRKSGTILSRQNVNVSGTSKLGSGALRGSLKGNVIVGTAMLTTDTAFSLYEYGGKRAFQNQGFYTNFGGAIGGMALGVPLGMQASAGVLLWTKNPLAAAAAGFVTTLAIGTIGNLGGRAATHRILEAVNPEFLHKEEDSAISAARSRISEAISLRQSQEVNRRI